MPYQTLRRSLWTGAWNKNNDEKMFHLNLSNRRDPCERNQQGLANELIEGAPARDALVGGIRRRPRLGGLLNYYCRAA